MQMLTIVRFGKQGLKVTFTEGAIKEIARFAAAINTSTDNIGARRLRTIIAKITEVRAIDVDWNDASNNSTNSKRSLFLGPELHRTQTKRRRDNDRRRICKEAFGGCGEGYEPVTLCPIML